MFQIQRLKDNLPPVRAGVALIIMMGVGISSLLENAVVNVTKRMYNNNLGDELDSTPLEDYLGN